VQTTARSTHSGRTHPSSNRPIWPSPRRTIASLLLVGASLIAQPALTHAQGAGLAPPGSVTDLRQGAADNDNAANPSHRDGGTISTDDHTAFLRSAISDTATDIEAARLAQTHAADPAVKQFAALVLQASQTRLQEAVAVGAKHGVSAPQSPTTDDEKALLADLANRNGKAFDETFLRAYIQDQRATLADYQKTADGLTDDVATFADRHRGMLAEQLRSAQELAKRLNIEVEQG
jgi:predicted outer membrane protein